MKTIRRIILIGLFLTIALTGIGGKALCEDVVYWVNPNGGEVADKMFRVGHIGDLTIEDNDKLISALKDLEKRGILHD